jgi:NAD(P)-dependent dehydrogenase (short-subunit alcohol dehydrogenase family)
LTVNDNGCESIWMAGVGIPTPATAQKPISARALSCSSTLFELKNELERTLDGRPAVPLAPHGKDMTVDLIEAIKPLIPLKRAADPDEIAGLVAYLARKESGYMTGSSLTIDGGMAI